MVQSDEVFLFVHVRGETWRTGKRGTTYKMHTQVKW